MKDTIFKAYDIRGIYPEEIDEEAAYKVGRAFVRYLSAKTIVVGHDMRTSSEPLKEKLVEGIACEGADVIDVGLCTTPMLNFAVANYGYDGGVMISASHNPKEYNAFKLINKDIEMLSVDSGLPQIKQMIASGFQEKSATGTVTQKDVLPDYVSHILQFSDGVPNLKVVCDYGNGMGAISAKPVWARFDLTITELYPDPNGEFPNHEPNPEYPKNFSDLKKAVKKEKADVGIFFDGDADRVRFVDEAGNIVPTDLLIALLAREELEKSPREKIYYDLRFSKAVAEEIKKAGGFPVIMRVGNPFYKKALSQDGGIMGAEYAGHIMFAENHNIDDGLLAAIKTLQLMGKTKKPLSELIESLKKYEDSEEVSIPAKTPDSVYERIYAAFPGKKIELDGAYVDLADGFVSVRQSQTEPQLFRVRVEAKTKEDLAARLNKTLDIVKS